ncbi:unnamed protein product [Ilex paraguariensis]|uniref:Uncharacterized protein n=1 Tax=Ilex paraguariensis TaxID=185542 RepID=A0ABC8S4G3_9AQUA
MACGRKGESGEEIKEERTAWMRNQEVEKWERQQENEANVDTETTEVTEAAEEVKGGLFGR